MTIEQENLNPEDISSENIIADNVVDEPDYKALCDEYREKYLRSVADYQNLQRRSNEQITSSYRASFDDTISKIVAPVYNNLKRGVESKVDGCELILKNLVTALNNNGVEILVPGEDFDSEWQYAVTSQPTDNDSLRGKISNVIEDGMKDTVNGKIIVDAKVIVYA